MADPSRPPLESSADPAEGDGHGSGGRSGLLDGLEMGLELVAAGRLAAVPLRRLPLRAGARLAGGGLRAMGRGAAAAALLEVPVAVIEESLAVRRGRKSPEEAALAAGAKVGAAAVGGGVGAGLAYGLGTLGVGTLLSPVAPVLLLVGGTTLLLSTGLRLQAALSADPPRPALHPEAPSPFIDLEPGQVAQGMEIWMAPPAQTGGTDSDRGEWGEPAEPR
ncbi:MAG: hypothetical protein VKJ05_06235 [Synechococcaceae cyanobacterium]|nr:hypothetical protein [Synechococcaceae cyanobacterium]